MAIQMICEIECCVKCIKTSYYRVSNTTVIILISLIDPGVGQLSSPSSTSRFPFRMRTIVASSSCPRRGGVLVLRLTSVEFALVRVVIRFVFTVVSVILQGVIVIVSSRRSSTLYS